MTAVEWLMLEKALFGYIDDEIVERANKLFEHQIKNAYNRGYQDATNDYTDMSIFEDADLYYNETYKKS